MHIKNPVWGPSRDRAEGAPQEAVVEIMDGARSETEDTNCRRELEKGSVTREFAPFFVHDINNLLAVISGGLRELEHESDAGCRAAIVGEMREAIERSALLSRQLLDNARPCPRSIDRLLTRSRLAAMSATLGRAVRQDITVCTEIAPDLWDLNADPEELYSALLNLCRNAADAMPNGGTINVAAHNVKSCADGIAGVEILVRDDGDGMTEEVLSQAFTPYFTTKPPSSGTGLGLTQVRDFVEGRGGAIRIKSELGVGTLVRFFLPRRGDCAPSHDSRPMTSTTAPAAATPK